MIPATNITRPAQVIMMENGRNSHSQMEDLAETVGALLSFMFQYLCRKIKKNLSFFIFLSWKRLLSRFTSQATKMLLKTESKSLFASVYKSHCPSIQTNYILCFNLIFNLLIQWQRMDCTIFWLIEGLISQLTAKYIPD